MSTLYNQLKLDVRFLEGLKSCMNCGTCTAICAAAEFYKYDPREIVDTVQSRNNDKILELLKGDTIWYCGECMSCKTRCPRGNVPGLVIMALRSLSQELGYFTESEKGRQQLAVKRTVGEWILKY
ncbi:MAG: 4Fe-4S dicluster domain-containing protein, partial [Bacteroidia bacterium]|nr:4Fe-4S dicluster domain-containing protein [Bacteroidia bacterium]